MTPINFCALILTHGRPERVTTYDTLRESGYTGEIRIVVDDLDDTLPAYLGKYGDEVRVFDKAAVARRVDSADNTGDWRTILYARNAAFDIARAEGFTHFIQLDDDYRAFVWRFDETFSYLREWVVCRQLDAVFFRLVEFLDRSGAATVAVAQGGDFIGGEVGSPNAKAVKLTRKTMNTFMCSTARPVEFVGRINEDVNTYVARGGVGELYLTTNQLAIKQGQTQASKGGMTDVYLDGGTYLKSFYPVLFRPGAVTIKTMGDAERRLHHAVRWNRAVPKILRESWKKGASAI